jgi:hypothetical protein
MLLVAVDLGERLREQPFTGIDAEAVASWIAVLGVSNFRNRPCPDSRSPSRVRIA